MVAVQTENRFAQGLMHLHPNEISSVQRALVELSRDPFNARLQTQRLAGVPDVYVLRASDQLRIIYRIERSEVEGPESLTIVAEDIISKDGLRRYLSGGDDEAF